MKRNTVIFLALGCAVSAGPLYAADSGSHKQGPSGTSAGMTNDTAKSYQDALDNCQKKTGLAQSGCINSVLKEKCRDMTGTAKSTCMKDTTGNHAGSPQNSSGIKRQQEDGRAGSPGGASMGYPANGPSGQSGAQTGSPTGSYQ